MVHLPAKLGEKTMKTSLRVMQGRLGWAELKAGGI